MFSVVFVCAGNTCRSPMAAAIAARAGGQASGIRFLSAGVAAADGQPASNHAQFLVHDHGGDLSGHRSRLLTGGIMEEADLVLTMTRAQHEEIVRRFPSSRSHVETLTGFAGGHDRDIADPVGGDLHVYETTYEEIERAVRAAMPRIVGLAQAKESTAR